MPAAVPVMSPIRFRQLLHRWTRELQDKGIPVHRIGSVTFAPLKKAFGRYTVMPDGLEMLQFSNTLLTLPEDFVISVICHELIHSIEGCRDHGALFKEYMDRVNRAFNLKVPVAVTLVAPSF